MQPMVYSVAFAQMGARMSEEKPTERAFDPKVISRLAHVLWRIQNEERIKSASQKENVDAWQREKPPFLDQARKIVRMAKSIDMIAKD